MQIYFYRSGKVVHQISGVRGGAAAPPRRRRRLAAAAAPPPHRPPRRTPPPLTAPLPLAGDPVLSVDGGAVVEANLGGAEYANEVPNG